jgi:hypothetical protein
MEVLMGFSSAVKVSKADPLVKRALKATFPNWKGRKVTVEPSDGRALHLDLNWSGGTRDEVKVIDFAHGRIGRVTVGAPWTHDGSLVQPEGTILVIHTIFLGVDVGMRIVVKPAGAAALDGAIAGLLASGKEA